tara:strand:- start:828 stop:1568 length:741 start_codon:yes stop_codon:yes gene_type:complete
MLIQYLGQEQQNYISDKLFTTPWTYPIDYGPTKNSNPDVFKNKNDSTTHKFILGPSTWLAMSSDIIVWLNKENENEEPVTHFFKNEISDGEKLWKNVNKYTHIYEQSLIESFKKLKTSSSNVNIHLFTSAFGELESKIMNCFHWDIISNTNTYSNASFDSIYNDVEISKLIADINNNSIIGTSELQNMYTEKNNIDESIFGNTLHTIIHDISTTKNITTTSIQAVQDFYCGKHCVCPFLDPVTTCV